jgi:large subunit GTPase 1
VCNGVLPIDRLTDVREPVAIVARQITRQAFEAAYKLRLPLPALHEDQDRRATAGEVLRAYAAARGLTVSGGRPDEQRAGRSILKDFITGKLLFCVGPAGYTGVMGVYGSAIGDDSTKLNLELIDEHGVFNGGGAGAAPSRSAARAYTRPLLSSTSADSDKKYTLNTHWYSIIPPDTS